MKELRTPFFIVNPKSYLYGKSALKLALAADRLAAEKDLDVFFTAPFLDIEAIAAKTRHLIVTAQYMDFIKAGRGMGCIVPEALAQAGVKAVFLNHAEHSLRLTDLVKTIERAKEAGLYSIVCADSVKEAKAIAMLDPDIILCEPTELIGTGNTSDNHYIKETTDAIKSVNPRILVMQAAGISNDNDVYKTILSGAEGTGCTSGIVCAANPESMLEEMLNAVKKAMIDGGK